MINFPYHYHPYHPAPKEPENSRYHAMLMIAAFGLVAFAESFVNWVF